LARAGAAELGLDAQARRLPGPHLLRREPGAERPLHEAGSLAAPPRAAGTGLARVDPALPGRARAGYPRGLRPLVGRGIGPREGPVDCVGRGAERWILAVSRGHPGAAALAAAAKPAALARLRSVRHRCFAPRRAPDARSLPCPDLSIA